MLKSARKQETDPEGRMPLVEHLRELRNRLAKGLLGIVVVTIVAAFFYKEIIEFFTDPVLKSVGCASSFAELANQKDGTCARIVLNGLLTPFTLALKVSLMAGVVFSSPVWLYQLWAFVAPGLHKHEKKYSLAFVGAGFPLFLAGGFFAYITLPTMARVLLEFSPADLDNQLPLDELLDLITRMVVVFGLSFELPLLLVMLNFGGIITGKRMLGWWRGMIMGITLFAAVATPSTDPVSMLGLAGPIWVLYFVATGISLLNDRRKAQIAAAGPDDDEASELDLTPEDVGEIESVSSARALPAQASSDRDRANGYDDIT
ncbi:twin-arginine translocase subunit TatC [Streptomyces sp. NBC_01591]|uniref:twin-arginine translocase subunit TatC n=1 Tax=Streptomyces sp. NBC_01591 TaxID=2975888 RepID=UPI002DDC0DD8|nr:twin-arginine translocase subunit TatC [Streptomyces sp. NBC_01591]WSD67468.1 twin-arginine translocase subunit TatC [Streptomyces sp. NBC_01591]